MENIMKLGATVVIGALAVIAMLMALKLLDVPWAMYAIERVFPIAVLGAAIFATGALIGIWRN